jgi:hypothetical protein
MNGHVDRFDFANIQRVEKAQLFGASFLEQDSGAGFGCQVYRRVSARPEDLAVKRSDERLGQNRAVQTYQLAPPDARAVSDQHFR